MGYNIKCMSMGFLMKESNAAIWRGPMISSAIQQLLYKVDWVPLDVLLVDLPPGTGDAQLSLIQNAPLSGAVIVSTPQPLALADVRRAVAMFRLVKTPIFGIVENMSGFQCPKCGETSEIFAVDGAAKAAKEFDIPFLSKINLSEKLRQCCDDGIPICIAQP